MNTKRRFPALVFFLFLAQASVAAGTSPQCGFQAAHEVPSASLYITNSTEFDNYRYLLVDNVEINGSQLSPAQQEVLREIIQQTVERKWQDYLGWRSTESAGTDVARLKVQVSAFTQEQTLKINTLLSDSLTNRQLMAQCNTSLKLHPKMVGLDSSQMYQKVNRWGADLGSHIMVAY